MKDLKKSIPSIITALRLLSAPFFYYLFLNSTCLLAFLIFVGAAITDIIDGRLARKYNATSVFGSYLDVCSDFILIICAFLAFIKIKWYCYLLILIIIASFAIFILTSRKKKLIYDPVGKYTGTILMVSILLTMLIPYPLIRKIITYIIALSFVTSICFRIHFLYKTKGICY
ncbi:MAG TPA: CDP-alcohol phosphatidyltransferase family protein [Bacillota bacterium]